MRRLLKIFLVFVFSFQLSALSSRSFAQDKIVAVVNNDIITQKDFNDFINFMKMQLSREYKGRELEEKIQGLKLDLLNKLIDDRLILQEANKEKIKIDENRVQGRINEVKKEYGSEAEFQKDLARQGITQADIEKRIREQMLMYYWIEGKIKSKIIVRPNEVTEFYNNNKEKFATPQARKFQAITLENENNAKSSVFDLRSGKKIEELATRYPMKVSEIEVSREGELRKDIEDAVFKLKIAEVSDPVEVNGKFVIFKLESMSSSRQLPLSEVQDQIQAHLFNNKSNDELKKWLDEIKAKSYIKICQN